jgi:hypothetical protein
VSTTALYRRIRRRETHSSRAVPAIASAVAAFLALAWLATEIALAAAGRAKLLLSPTDMVDGIRGLPGVAPSLLTAAGTALAVLGLILVVLALKGGRLGRHLIDDERAVVVVHDEVIGSALVRAAADASGTDPDQGVAAIGRRRAQVRLTPSSGIDIDRGAVGAAVAERLVGFRIRPALTSRVSIVKKGRVGA